MTINDLPPYKKPEVTNSGPTMDVVREYVEKLSRENAKEREKELIKILIQDKSMLDPFRTIFTPKPMPWTHPRWNGIPIEIDPTLPPGTWKVRYADGSENELLPESKRND